MPVTVSYPGIYINEVLSSAHTITAAPTSIAVFIGYTHPFKTRQFNAPVQLFSFNDYQREFGGFFANRAFDAATDFASVALAVYQFFLNGGAECYVVGLQALSSDSLPEPITAQAVSVGGVTFTQIEPTEPRQDPNDPTTGHEMWIQVDNVQPNSAQTVADVTITYGAGLGARWERVRGVSLVPTLGPASNLRPNPNYIATRIGTASQFASTLVTVDPSTLPNAFTVAPPTAGQPPPMDRQQMPATVTGSVIVLQPNDFATATQANSLLDKLPVFNLVNLPGVTENGVLSAAVALCERNFAFLIVDPPPNSVVDDPVGTQETIDAVIDGSGAPPFDKNAALYFPYLQANDPVTGAVIEMPPGGSVAGIIAQTDLNRGVWKAPAGYATTIVNTLGVVQRGRMTNQQQGVLNPIGVNCLRDFPGIGTVVFGARTLVTNNPSLSHDWGYVPVRRMALFLEQTLLANLGWAVFEPNDTPLWTAIRNSIEAFMLGLFRQGAFQGATPSDAFQVKCDDTTTTQADIDNGIVNIVVAFAPLKPAEFVVVTITQLAGQAQLAA